MKCVVLVIMIKKYNNFVSQLNPLGVGSRENVVHRSQAVGIVAVKFLNLRHDPVFMMIRKLLNLYVY